MSASPAPPSEFDSLGLEVPFADEQDSERFDPPLARDVLGESPFAEAATLEAAATEVTANTWSEAFDKQVPIDPEELAWLDVEAPGEAEWTGETPELEEETESTALEAGEDEWNESEWNEGAWNEGATNEGEWNEAASDRTWIHALDRSALERLPDATTRARYLAIDWADVEFPGNVPKNESLTDAIKEHWRLSESLFSAMTKVVPERRVPSSIRFHDPVVVKVPGQPRHQLFAEALEAFVRMRDAAKADGIRLVITSSFRTRKKQQALSKKQSNSKAVARGNSAHMYGLAIDVLMQVPGLPIAQANTRLDKAEADKRGTLAKMGNVVRMYRSPVYKWLALRAREFGWYPYRREPWHWEYNPPGFKARFEGAATASEADETSWEQLDETVAEANIAEAEDEARTTTAPLTRAFDVKALGMKVAVLVTEAARTADQVDVLVFAHGLDVCRPVVGNRPMTFVTGRPLNLGALVEASRRPIVLVVPYFDWEHLKQNGMAFGRKWHKIAKPELFNQVIAEALEQARTLTGRAAAPALQRLILAGHSRAFGFFDALAHAHAAPEMRQGALARLTHVWALDTTYTAPVADWRAWLRSRDDFKATVVYRHGSYRTRNDEVRSLPTGVRGKQFDALAADFGGRLSTMPVAAGKTSHCNIPATYLPRLLAALPGPPPSNEATYAEYEDEDESECEDREFELLDENNEVLESFEPEALADLESLMREPPKTKPEETRLRPHLVVVDAQDKPIADGEYVFRQGNVVETGSLSSGYAFFGKVDPSRPFVFEIRDRVCAIRAGAFLDPDERAIEYGGTRHDWTLVRDNKQPDKEFWPHYLLAMQQDTGPDTSRRGVDRFWQHEHITRRQIQLTKAAQQRTTPVRIRAIPLQIRSGPLVRYTDHGRATVWLELVTPGMVKLSVRDSAGGKWEAYASTVRVGGRHFAIAEVEGLKEASEYQYTVELAPLPGAGPVPVEAAQILAVFPTLQNATRAAIEAQLKPAARQGSTRPGFRTLRRKYDKSLRFATGSCRWYPGDSIKDWPPEKVGPDMLKGLGTWLRDRAPSLWPDFLFFGGDQIYADEVGDKHYAEIVRGRFSCRLPGPSEDSNATVANRLVDGAWAGRFTHRYKDINPLSQAWLKHASVVEAGLKKLDQVYASYPILEKFRDGLVTRKQMQLSYDTEHTKRASVQGAKNPSDYERKMQAAIALIPKVEALEISTAPYRVYQDYWCSGRQEVLANPRAFRYRSCNFLLWKLPDFEDELPTLKDQASSESGVRRPNQFGHPSANKGRHAGDFAEYGFLYERAWTSSPEVRFALGNIPTFLMFDDHEVTDDWNVDTAWMRMIHSSQDHYRMWPKTITDALCAYWMYQGWGNKAPSQWKQAGDPRAALVAAAQGAGTDALPELRKLVHAACVAGPNKKPAGIPDLAWYYRLPFDPPFLVPDCRSRKRMLTAEDDWTRIDHDKKSPMSQTIDDGQIGWMRAALATSKDAVAFIAPSTPLLLPQAPMEIMTNPDAFAKAWAADSTWDAIRAFIAPTPTPRLTKRFRRDNDLEHMVRDKSWRDLWGLVAGKRNTGLKTLVLVSGDVHHSYCMTANLPGSGRPKPEVLQITSSGLQTKIRLGAKEWYAEGRHYTPFHVGQYRISPGFMSDSGTEAVTAGRAGKISLYKNAVAIVDVKVGSEVDVNVTHLLGGRSGWHMYKYSSRATGGQGETPEAFEAYVPADEAAYEADSPSWMEDTLAPDDEARVEETFRTVLDEAWPGEDFDAANEGMDEATDETIGEAMDESIGGASEDEATDTRESMEALDAGFEHEDLDAYYQPTRRDRGSPGTGGAAPSPVAPTLSAGIFARFVTADRLDLEIADILRALDTYPSGSWAKQLATFAFHELDVGNLAGIFSSASVARAKAAVPAAEQTKVANAAASIGNGVTVYYGSAGAWKGEVLIATTIVQAGKSHGQARERFAEVLAHELTHFRNRDFFIALEKSTPSANPGFYVDLAKANAYSGTPGIAWYVMGEVTCNHVAWRVRQDLRNRSRKTPVPTNPNLKGFYRYALALDGGAWRDNGYLADLKTAGRYNEQIALWMLKIGGERALFHDDPAKNTATRQLFKDVYDRVKPAFDKPTEGDDGGV
ncbi:D-alanyl-D-alanine carboxypeptidase family protein [Lysobacter sp. CFH 32150]|uniref:DUF7800 domain-containing protein n=1 Tax=Lysobacter sp. CFH 32150 TaxID=2927128 RepID=UPI001FA74E5A|nr:D-alanyl-D-alanine carboxypeptidase family protein [Lysobacter sp. CFH 32150]MCI4568154.1 D-alanyl-D-alanine carboxypeptidase family protein [Lysobacter sp. CFH 32150]